VVLGSELEWYISSERWTTVAVTADRQNKMLSFIRMCLDMSSLCFLKSIEMLGLRSIIFVLPSDPSDCSISALFCEITFYEFLMVWANSSSFFRSGKSLQCWILMFCFILAQKMVQTSAPKLHRWVENSSSHTWLDFFLSLFVSLLNPTSKKEKSTYNLNGKLNQKKRNPKLSIS
jgi:hypothetical protein